MSLIDNTTPGQQELSLEQKQTRAKNRIKNAAKNIYETVKNKHDQLWNVVWDNPAGLTPQEVIDAFGTDAKELFTYSQSLQTLLSEANENYVVKVTPNLVTINTDGSVTVGEPRA